MAQSTTFSNAMRRSAATSSPRTYVDVPAYIDVVTADARPAPGARRRPRPGRRPMLNRLDPGLADRGRRRRERRPGPDELVAPRRRRRRQRSPDQRSAIAGAHPGRRRSSCRGPGRRASASQVQLDAAPGAARDGRRAQAVLDQVAGGVGGLDALIGWVDDVGVVVSADGRHDPAAASSSSPTRRRRGDRARDALRSLLALAGVGERHHRSATSRTAAGRVTIVDLGDLGRQRMAPGQRCRRCSHVEISFTVAGRARRSSARGPAWVDVDRSTSSPGRRSPTRLATSSAIGPRGASNRPRFYLDISAASEADRAARGQADRLELRDRHQARTSTRSTSSPAPAGRATARPRLAVVLTVTNPQ